MQWNAFVCFKRCIQTIVETCKARDELSSSFLHERFNICTEKSFLLGNTFSDVDTRRWMFGDLRCWELLFYRFLGNGLQKKRVAFFFVHSTTSKSNTKTKVMLKFAFWAAENENAQQKKRTSFHFYRVIFRRYFDTFFDSSFSTFYSRVVQTDIFR